jgi:NitT/TauT family transport system ATP-binding protein
LGSTSLTLRSSTAKKSSGNTCSRTVPLAAHICRVLDDRPGHRAPTTRFQEELEDCMGEDEAQQTLRAIVSWGRYAEVFANDQEVGTFSLEDPR